MDSVFVTTGDRRHTVLSGTVLSGKVVRLSWRVTRIYNMDGWRRYKFGQRLQFGN